jgi:hypothetical protein
LITRQQLEQIARHAKVHAVSETVVDQLRSSFTDIHFTYCMDDDVVAAIPVYEDPTFNLYLIDSSNHCLCFTQDMGIATGVVVAEREAEC